MGVFCLEISTHLLSLGFQEPSCLDFHWQALQEVQKHPRVQAGILYTTPAPGIAFLPFSSKRI